MTDLPPWLANKSSGFQRAHLGRMFVRDEDLAEWLVHYLLCFGWRTPEECRDVQGMLLRSYPYSQPQKMVWFFRRMFKI